MEKRTRRASSSLVVWASLSEAKVAAAISRACVTSPEVAPAMTGMLASTAASRP
jgi:hypothetical protein